MDCPETPYLPSLQEVGYPERYRDRRFRSGSGPGTHRREVGVLRRLLAHAGEHARAPWLDVPAGAGRLTDMLPSAADTVQADNSLGMLQAAGPGHRRICASAQRLPFPDRSFAGVLCMRLLHHIPGPEERVRILRELARVSRGPVVFSFFHAVSLQHLRRLLRRRLRGRKSARTAIRLATLAEELHAAGLTLVKAQPLCRLVSEQWLVLASCRP